VQVVGIPGTIDNNLEGAISLGYHSAMALADQSIESLKATSAAMGSVFFVEVMGAGSGHLALACAYQARAEGLLVNEHPDPDAYIDGDSRHAEAHVGCPWWLRPGRGIREAQPKPPSLAIRCGALRPGRQSMPSIWLRRSIVCGTSGGCRGMHDGVSLARGDRSDPAPCRVAQTIRLGSLCQDAWHGVAQRAAVKSDA
jgi:hypothetical protein